jgi:hypothetical protein
MSLKKHIFIYDKDNCLNTYAELSSKDKLIGYYFLENNQLTKVNIYKEKKALHTKRTIVVFDEDVKLNHMFLDGFGSRVVAVKRHVMRIETPVVKNRIETLDNESFNRFTVKSDIINSWLDKL